MTHQARPAALILAAIYALVGCSKQTTPSVRTESVLGKYRITFSTYSPNLTLYVEYCGFADPNPRVFVSDSQGYEWRSGPPVRVGECVTRTSGTTGDTK